MCLGRTSQDADGRLMDIVDEDPAWGWILPGGQFCKEIDGIVVPSRDVMQLDSLELVLKLAHRLVVCYHEGAFAGGLLHDLINDQLRVTTNVESRSTKFEGDAESIDEGLVLRGIV